MIKLKPSTGISNSASSQRACKHNNEQAQAAVIFLFVVGLIAIIAIFIWMSPVMDSFTGFHNNATQGTATVPAFLELSQERQDSIFITQTAYRVYPLLAFILLLIAAYVAALRWRTGTA